VCRVFKHQLKVLGRFNLRLEVFNISGLGEELSLIFHEVGLAEILQHSLQLSHLKLKPLNESLTLIQLVLRLLVLGAK
jgi:hypothetical protein